MKTRIKTVVFFTLVFVVGLGVYGGTKNTKGLKKKHKFIVGFGWSETAPCELDPVARSAADVKAYLDGLNTGIRYKIQNYTDGNPQGAPEGDLCLANSAVAMAANAAPTSGVPQAGPSGTPSGAKTQSGGYAEFNDPAVADAFTDWVNSTSAVPSKAKATKK